VGQWRKHPRPLPEPPLPEPPLPEPPLPEPPLPEPPLPEPPLPEPPLMPFILRALVGLSMGALSFVVLIFIINPLQMLSVVIYPFSPKAFRAINTWFGGKMWGFWAWMAYGLNRIRIRITGDAVPQKENALLISNHQSIADVMVLICFSARCGREADLKWFVKDIIKYVPGPGWGMRFLDCIFVKRNWTRDRDAIERLFGKYAAHQIPVFVISFLEGTRRNARNAQQAQDFARKNDLPVPQHTLIPRTKGFVASVTGLRTHLDAVYDITIGYPERVPSLADCFACRVPHIEIHLKRHAIDTLPQGPDELAAWAFQKFREKDELLADFQGTYRFPGVPVMERKDLRRSTSTT
jgi:1-acyl-sn-glycerol-3-phosphate acyltransferase